MVEKAIPAPAIAERPDPSEVFCRAFIMIPLQNLLNDSCISCARRCQSRCMRPRLHALVGVLRLIRTEIFERSEHQYSHDEVPDSHKRSEVDAAAICRRNRE